MSLLLCRKKADQPFFHSKLNIGIWSEQELCYIIYSYPLLCLGDFLDEKLFSWIENELQMKRLADMLRSDKRTGENGANMLLRILQSCSYYDVQEMVNFGNDMAELRKCSEDELMRKEGHLLYHAGKYLPAYDKLSESVRYIDAELKRARLGTAAAAALNARKADILCDMAVIRLRMADEEKALELLIASQLCSDNERAVSMRYLVNGAGELSDEKKAELDGLKADAVRRSRETREYQEISELFDKDSVRILKEARPILSRWKNNYRMM